MGSVANKEQVLSGEVVSHLPAWIRITDPLQLEVGCEYYITWYSKGWMRYKNTIAEFIGDLNETGDVTFDHSDLPWGSLEELRVYVAPRNPNSDILIANENR